jgi:hypothetical protein
VSESAAGNAAGGEIAVEAVAAVAVEGRAELDRRAVREVFPRPRVLGVAKPVVDLLERDDVGRGGAQQRVAADLVILENAKPIAAPRDVGRGGHVRHVLGEVAAVLGEVHCPGDAHLPEV